MRLFNYQARKLFLLCFFPIICNASIHNNNLFVINYNGLILNINGHPVNERVKINFSIIDEQNQIKWQNRKNVFVQNGKFHVKLGQNKPLDCIILNRNYYIQVDPESGFIAAEQINKTICSNPLNFNYKGFVPDLLLKQIKRPGLIDFSIYNENGESLWNETKILKMNNCTFISKLGTLSKLSCDFFNGKHFLNVKIKANLNQQFFNVCSFIPKTAFSLRQNDFKHNKNNEQTAEKNLKKIDSLIQKNVMNNQYSYQEDYKIFQMWPILRQSWYFSMPLDLSIDKKKYIYVVDSIRGVHKLTNNGFYIKDFRVPNFDESPISITQNSNFMYYLDVRNAVIRKYNLKTNNCTFWDIDSNYIINLDSLEPFGFIEAIEEDLFALLLFPDKRFYLQKYSNNGKLINDWLIGEGSFAFAVYADQDKLIFFVTDMKGVRKYHLNNSNPNKLVLIDNEFVSPEEGKRITALATDKNGTLYVRSFYKQKMAEKISKYSLNGKMIEEIDISSLGLPQFYDEASLQSKEKYIIPIPIPDFLSLNIDENFNMYLTLPITILSPEGRLLQSWKSSSNSKEKFYGPHEILMENKPNNNNILYILDSFNFRIQLLNLKGNFIKEIKIPMRPYHGMSIDLDKEHFFLASADNHISQLDKNGKVLYDAEHKNLRDICYYKDKNDNKKYLAVLYLNSLKTYILDEEGIIKPESSLNLSEQSNIVLDRSWDMAGNFFCNQLYVDANNKLIYIAVSKNCCIYTYDYYGNLLNKMELSELETTTITEMSSDIKGNFYVLLNYFSSKQCDNILKYSPDKELISTFGRSGQGPGMLFEAKSICPSPDGLTIYVADSGNNRIQVFTQQKRNEGITKAIIIAGGGQYDRNTIWDATQMNANYAYQSMLSNGIKPDEIFYLSASKDSLKQDMDNDGIPDVDGIAFAKNLKTIIDNEVNDADFLVIYMVDHGGIYHNLSEIEGIFHMNRFEDPITASELNTFIEKFKNKLVLIIDACYSGAFLPKLSSKNRVIISSTSSNEKASFLSQGNISFSHFFWSCIYRGNHVRESFKIAKAQMQTNSQIPEINYNIENNQIWIGRGNKYVSDPPVIIEAGVKPEVINDSSATLYALIDGDHYTSVAEVTAIIKSVAPSINVIEPETINLIKIEKNKYEIKYDNFNIPGSYNIIFTAYDSLGNVSSPKLCEANVKKNDHKKAVIIVGKIPSFFNKNYVKEIIPIIMDALLTQRFLEDNIFLFSPEDLSFFVNNTGKVFYPTCNDLMMLLEGLKEMGPGIEDLIIYYIGNINSNGFILDKNEILTHNLFSDVLNYLENEIKGKVIFIFESTNTNSFMDQLSLNEDYNNKILFISSTTDNQIPHFLDKESISFSNIFWTSILKGETLGISFSNVKTQIELFYGSSQTTFIDTNNDKKMTPGDKSFANKYHLGYGVMPAYEGPIIVSSVSPGIQLYGEHEATITATVIPSKMVDKVFGIIHSPLKTKDYYDNIPRFELTLNKNTNQFSGTYSEFNQYGIYNVSIFAKNKNGAKSSLVSTSVTQSIGPDVYENDDILSRASLIVIDDKSPGMHTFHSKDDIDWFMFYALDNETYEFSHDLNENIEFQFNMYAKDGITNILNETYDNLFYWPNYNKHIESGIYYFSFNPENLSDSQFPTYTFHIKNKTNDAPLFETGIQGNVYDNITKNPVSRALIKMDTLSALSDSTMIPNYYIFGAQQNTTYILNVQSTGYKEYTNTLVVKENTQWTTVNIGLEPLSNEGFYILNAEKIGNGNILKKPSGNKILEKIDMYDKNSPVDKVLLKAIPDDGWEFLKWSNECSGITPTCLITMDDNKFVIAQFRKKNSSSIQYPQKIANNSCFISSISNNNTKDQQSYFETFFLFVKKIIFCDNFKE